MSNLRDHDFNDEKGAAAEPSPVFSAAPAIGLSKSLY
jgi:hypothetical protein